MIADASVDLVRFGPFRLFPAARKLVFGTDQVSLGGRAMDVLLALARKNGELVSKEELFAAAWPNTFVHDDNLKVTIAALRRSLRECWPEAEFISTVVGRGYWLNTHVSPDDAGEEAPSPAVGSAPSRNQNLPSGIARVYGRADEIEVIGADLKKSRLVSIVGAGGIGKTTVAIAVAETFVGARKDGVWIVDFATLQDPSMAPAAIASALGMKTHSAAILDALCGYLHSREMLLVFDNCEHVIETAALCADRILTDAGGVGILATSREPLGVRGEKVRRLRGLGVPTVSSDLKSSSALSFPAIQLFVDRATERLESFELRDEDAPAAADICSRLDGLPLAIELAATRIDTFTVAGLLTQLDGRFRALAGRRAGPERQRTLIATLDWSYNLLPPEEAELLDAVSVFAGSFGAEDAAALAGGAPADAAERLARIAAKSLLSIDLDKEEIAYRLLETTRAYCLSRLQDAGKLDPMQRRHAQRICAVLAQAQGEGARGPARNWGERYRPVLSDLRLALAWAGANPAERLLLIDLTIAGTLLWNHLSLTNECRVAVLRAVSDIGAAGLSGTETEMRLLTSLASAIMFTRGPMPEVPEASERALQIAIALGSNDFQLRNLWMLAGHGVFTGSYAGAIERLGAFLSVASDKDPSAIQAGQTLLALAEFYVGQVSRALQRIEPLFQIELPSLDITRLARFTLASSTNHGVSLPLFQWVVGKPDQAVRTTEIVIHQALLTGHEMTVVIALVMSGCPVALWTRRHEDANRHLMMLERLVEQHGLATWRPVALYFRGALACTDDDRLDEGIDDLRRAMAGLDAMNHRQRTPYFLGTLAEALARSGRLAEAASTIGAALERARAQGEAWCTPELLRIQASILIADGRSPEAEALLVRSMALAEEGGALSWQLRSANDLATLWCSESRTPEARTMLLPVYRKFTEGHGTGDLLYASKLLERA